MPCSWPGWSASSLQFPSLCAFVLLCVTVGGRSLGVFQECTCGCSVITEMVTHAGWVQGSQAVGGVCVCVCACTNTHVHTECPFGRQFLDVKGMHLSPRQCEDSLCLLGGSDLQGSLSVL